MATNGLMANAKPYPLVVDTRVDSSGAAMMRDLEAGDIDVGVLWGPMAGYYAQQARPDDRRAAGQGDDRSAPCYRIAMGVRFADQDWKRLLNRTDCGETRRHQQLSAELWGARCSTTMIAPSPRVDREVDA
jgi:ABC-type amino acid transport substrate-binding protein